MLDEVAVGEECFGADAVGCVDWVVVEGRWEGVKMREHDEARKRISSLGSVRNAIESPPPGNMRTRGRKPAPI